MEKRKVWNRQKQRRANVLSKEIETFMLDFFETLILLTFLVCILLALPIMYALKGLFWIINKTIRRKHEKVDKM